MFKLMQKLKLYAAVLLLAGCVTQSVEVENQSSGKDFRQSITVFGVSPELHEEALKEGEKAKNKLDELEKDRSLSGTAKRILAEAEEAEEQGDEARSVSYTHLTLPTTPYV